MKLLKQLIDFFGYWLVGRQFIAGRTRKEMFKRAKKLKAQGFEITINLLGEHYRDDKRVKEAVGEYISLIYEIPQELGCGAIALKLSQIGVEISEKLCMRNLEFIAMHARKNNVGLEIDMESTKHAISTYRMFLSFSYKANYHKLVRVAVQANHPQVYEHSYLLDFPKHNIRLVKGAAYKGEAITDENIIHQRFIGIARHLVKMKPKESTTDIYLATVRDRKLVESIRYEIPDNRTQKEPTWKFQMLYGPWRSLQNELLREGYPVVMYLPYGEEWMAYGMRRWRFILKIFVETVKRLYKK